MKKIKNIWLLIPLLCFANMCIAQTSNNGELGITTATQFAVQGDYTNNNNTLRLELGSSSENNLLVATGNIALSGTLKIEFVNGFMPTTSQSFIIITGNAISGNFSSLSFPNGYIADIVYNANNVVLSNFRSSLVPITGNLLACTIGTTNRLYIATSGGTWSSSNTNVATVNSGGYVTSVANGSATINYTYTSSGNTNISNATFVVAAVPVPNTITGASSICVGASTTLSNTTPSGVWSTGQTSQASVNATTGVVNGLSAGNATINYTVTNASGCRASVNKNIVVNAMPAVPSVAYAIGTPLAGSNSIFSGAPNGSFCVGKSFGLVGNPNSPVGAWSATGAASITSAGVVSINSVGAGTIKYTYTNTNGCSSSRTLTGNGFSCAARMSTADSRQSTIDGEQWSVYPNPARSQFTIYQSQLIGSGSIVVADLYGKQVKKQALSMGTNTIDVSSFAKGMYFVSIITEQGKQTQKVVVE